MCSAELRNFEIDPDRVPFSILDDVGDDLFADEPKLEREPLCHTRVSEPGHDRIEGGSNSIGPTRELEMQVSLCIEGS